MASARAALRSLPAVSGTFEPSSRSLLISLILLAGPDADDKKAPPPAARYDF